MATYSTCRRCRTILTITNIGQNTHPGCEPKPTRYEQLLTDLADAADDDEADELAAQALELEARPPNMLAYALAYAAWGWPVFPLRPCSKQPSTQHGFKDANTDIHRINTWWQAHPHHNIGLATGHAFDVIDVDLPHGPKTFTQLEADGFVPDIHGVAATASGGRHLYVEPSGAGNAARIAPGIDYRGRGGYVVAPPSTLGHNHTWAWLVEPSPTITGMTPP